MINLIREDFSYACIWVAIWIVAFSLFAGCASGGKESNKVADASRWRFFNPLEKWFENTTVTASHDGDEIRTGITNVQGDQIQVNTLPSPLRFCAYGMIALAGLLIINRISTRPYRLIIAELTAAIHDHYWFDDKGKADSSTAMLLRQIRRAMKSMGWLAKRRLDKILKKNGAEIKK